MGTSIPHATGSHAPPRPSYSRAKRRLRPTTVVLNGRERNTECWAVWQGRTGPGMLAIVQGRRVRCAGF
eukprot:scaffold108838_cov63-Phaeocystis_antarctica.AAC.5